MVSTQQHAGYTAPCQDATLTRLNICGHVHLLTASQGQLEWKLVQSAVKACKPMCFCWHVLQGFNITLLFNK
jgi:hypothetical protein